MVKKVNEAVDIEQIEETAPEEDGNPIPDEDIPIWHSIAGTCRFCGQVGNVIGYRRFASQEEANDYATEHCGCSRAENERRIQRQISNANSRVYEVFGEGAEAHGFRPVADQSIFNILENCIELVARRLLSSATLQIRGYCKATISLTSKGEIVIARSETRAFKSTE